MAAFVAGAGYMAGAAAAQAIFGKPTMPGPDTTVPGISSATIRKGKKGQPDIKVPQVDISQSLAWFKEAADTQSDYYKQGLGYYITSLGEASKQVSASYNRANQTLAPLSYSSNQAMNEQMRMMGLDPISSSYGFSDRAKGIGLSGDTVSKLAAAEKIQDPTERAAAKAQILGSIKDITGKASTLDKDLAALGPVPIDASTYAKAGKNDNNMELSAGDPIMREILAMNGSNDAFNTGKGYGGIESTAYNAARDSLINKKKAYDAKAQALKEAEALRLATNKTYDDFASEYEQAYGAEYDKGYTGEEVSARVAATPGYQFQVEQGTKAIERQGAAKGMLGSGNTLIGLTQYGQQQGQNFYGMYMDNLSRIVNEGSGATSQLAANQVNEGVDQAKLTEAGGAAYMNTYANIGDAYAKSLYASGNLYAETARFNAAMQDAGIRAFNGQQNSGVDAGISSAAGMMNAQTNANQFNYGVFKDTQAAQQYFGGQQQTYKNYGGPETPGNPIIV